MKDEDGSEPPVDNENRCCGRLPAKRLDRPPWWLMRQAGRYLPEYRAVRAQARRFCRVLPDPRAGGRGDAAAGPPLWHGCGDPVCRHPAGAACAWTEGRVRRGRAAARADRGRLRDRRAESGEDCPALEPVYETVRRSRAALPPETALIGFAGAPWTVATYMVEGGASRDFRRVKAWAYRDPAGFRGADRADRRGDDRLSCRARSRREPKPCSCSTAGPGCCPRPASSAGSSSRRDASSARLKQRFPTVPMIGFPRGAGLALSSAMPRKRGVDAVELDSASPGRLCP